MGNSIKSGSNTQRGYKPYALMLMFAFVAAILGVMVLHKLREKRIFTLLVQDKHQQLLTLQLLFQREKEFNQQARKKIEEMKNKVYTLRTQKLELDRKLSEMESKISSLQDERKVIELTLEEKNNEIKMLTASENSGTGDSPRVAALKDLIKMKEDEKEKEMENSQEKAKKTQINQEDERQKVGNNEATNGSGDHRYQESLRHTSFHEGGQTLEKPDGSENEIGWSRKKLAGKGEYEIKKEASWKGQLVLSDNINQTEQTADDDQSGEKGAEKHGEEREKISTGIESNENNDKNGNTILISAKNQRKQISDVSGKQLHEQEAIVKQERVQSIEVKKHEYVNEQGNEALNEEGEIEDSEDAETHEPEIDTDDIRRFSESDPEEEAGETEF